MKFIEKYKHVIFLLLIFIICFSLYVPALFSVDDMGYYLMGKSFAEEQTFRVWTGYEEFKTTAFGIFQPVYSLSGDSLYVKYPPFYAFISAPFYKLFHLRGLFILNILSFAGTIYFLYLLSLSLFDSKKMGERVVLVYVFATFSVEYAIGLWPHMLSVFLVVSGAYFFIKYLKSEDAGIFNISAAIALFGLSIGVRLQNIVFLGIAFAAMILLKKDLKAVFTAAVAGGSFLIIEGAINKERFGSFDPFSYGHYKGKNLGYYLQYPEYFVLFGLFALLFFLFARKRKLSPKIKYSIIGVSFLILVTAFLSNRVIRGIFYYWAYTLYCNLVDLSAFYKKSGLIIGDSGAILYGGVVKKSLLQSCPYLILSFLSPFIIFKEKGNRSVSIFLSSLLVIPLAFISSFFFHGGYAFNIRYALEFLPFAVILFCWLIRNINFQLKEFLIAGLLSSPFPFIFYYQRDAGLIKEMFILYCPLLMASLLLVVFVVKTFKGRSISVGSSSFVNILILISLFYSFSAGWAGDLTASRRLRLNNYYSYSSLSKEIKSDSLLIMLEDIGVEILPLKEYAKIRIAYVPVEKIETYLGMIGYYLEKNIPVSFISTKTSADDMRGVLRGYFSIKEKKIGKFALFEIVKRKIDMDVFEKKDA